MSVQELIEILEGMDPEAAVYLAVQPEYPFEVAVAGICQRGDYAEDGEDEEGAWTGGDLWSASESQLPKNDVLILAGSQVRYGARAAWDAAERP